MPLLFEYDPKKARINLRKHGVSFDEAITAFDDELYILLPDERHSHNEERWIILATSAKERVLVIVYTEIDFTVRLISARVATATERATYAEG